MNWFLKFIGLKPEFHYSIHFRGLKPPGKWIEILASKNFRLEQSGAKAARQMD
jgi:hypothetical protein